MSIESHYDVEAYLRRHKGVQNLMRFLVPNPHLAEQQRQVADSLWVTAVHMCEVLDDGPELTAGLRKLLEAKDCFVRQSILDEAREDIDG